MKLAVFIIVDTDFLFGQLFEQNLKAWQVAIALETIVPICTLPAKSLVSDVLKKVKERHPNPDDIAAIFVDLVVHGGENLYGAGDKPASYDTMGIQIALMLRTEFPQTPIFIVTERTSNSSELSLMSEASLEDVDGVFAKNFLTGKGFSSERLDLILGKALIKRQRRTPIADNSRVHAAPAAHAVPPSIDIAGSRATFEIATDECGPQLWDLLSTLLGEGSKRIEVLQPGRSGAAVFKITVKHTMHDTGLRTEPKNWIVKMAHDRALIEREIKNYSLLKATKLHRSAYPQLLADAPSSADGLWGIALSFEGEASTLRDYLKNVETDSDAERIAKCLTDALQKLYSTDPISEPGLWSHYWTNAGAQRAKLTNLLKDMESIAAERGLLAEHQAVCNFVQTNGESCPAISLRNVDQFETRWIHGDLNSGNVLVSAPPSNNIILIDFASAGKGHVVKDFAKLERDVYFRVIDGEWTSGSSDWERMEIWKRLVLIAASKSVLANEHLTLNERAVLAFIRELRSGLVTVDSKITIREYLVGLVFYSLTALLIPETSLQKKMFGIWYVSELLERAERSAQADLLKDWATPA
jgi:aminoglycoside phosphotransferase (APT) family kinase protein